MLQLHETKLTRFVSSYASYCHDGFCRTSKTRLASRLDTRVPRKTSSVKRLSPLNLTLPHFNCSLQSWACWMSFSHLTVCFQNLGKFVTQVAQNSRNRIWSHLVATIIYVMASKMLTWLFSYLHLQKLIRGIKEESQARIQIAIPTKIIKTCQAIKTRCFP